MSPPDAAVVVATYAVIAAFYARLGLHALVWWEAVRRSPPALPRGIGAFSRALAGAALDVVFLRRLLMVNPALWLGEWVFHVSLFVVLLRHLRYVLDPIPAWVAWAQTPGWIAGFLLPAALLYILVLRVLTRLEKFSARANLLVLLDVLVLAVSGLLLSTRFRTDLTAVKLFAFGIVSFTPSPPPAGALFALHLGLALALLLYVPSHVFTAPLVMLDARGRELALRRVIHDA